MKNALTDIGHLKDWFFEQDGAVLWTLYHGKNTKSSSTAAKQENPDKELDESWEILERNLHRFGETGGNFTVLVKRGNSDGIGRRMYINMNSASKAVMAGVPSYGGERMDYGRLRGLIEQESERKANQKAEIIEMKHKMKEYENMLQSQQTGTFWEEFLKGMAESGQLNRFFQVLMMRFGPNAASEMNGMDIPEPSGQGRQQAQPEQTPDPDDVSGSDDEFTYEFDRLRPSLERLRKHFPNIYESIDQLSRIVEKNPGAAKAFLNQGSKDGD